MEAVQQIKEVVPQVEPVIVIELDSESENDCGDSQAEEEEVYVGSKPPTSLSAVRYCVNPAHVKGLDEDENIEVISMTGDTSHSPEDLIWDDHIEDETSDELVCLLKERLHIQEINVCWRSHCS
ncbi:unnamed protein product [Brassica oleracea var. botrytis]|uniref:(rape) hypothetical protein n=1 Tax=Brassica napus TaxID=3708 RepID=A0A816UHH8_BRANA|nr:unnamed protein product [Brassica napus]